MEVKQVSQLLAQTLVLLKKLFFTYNLYKKVIIVKN